MVNRIRTGLDDFQDRGVRGHIRTRESFLARKDRRDAIAFEHGSGSFETCDRDLLISWIREPIRVDERVIFCVGRVDADVAS